MSRSFETSGAPEIEIKCDGDLIINGVSGNQVCMDDDEHRVDTHGNTLRITCESDCSMQVPHKARVHVRRAHGSVIIERFDYFRADGIEGDLNADGVARVEVAGVGGDMRVVSGALAANNGATVGVGGDAHFAISRDSGEALSVAAGGDIVCDVHARRDVTIQIRSGHGFLNRQIGAGGAVINLSCGGEARLAGADEHDGKAGKVHAEFHFDSAEFMRRFAESWAHSGFNMPGVDPVLRKLGDRLRVRIEQKLHKAANRAAQQAQRAARKAERAARWGNGWNVDVRSPDPGGWTVRHPSAPPPAQPSEPAVAYAEPVTDQERLTILRLVEQKKITIEQAENLLRAMEA